MYESHFGFHRQPFQCAELPQAFFASEAIRTILPQLFHALRSDLGIAVLTGPPGVGKTSLLRHLQSVLSHEGIAVVCSGSSLETPAAVLLTLQNASKRPLDGDDSAGLAARPEHVVRWNVVEHLRKNNEFAGPVLLLIDDAHLMPVQVLNELRALTEEESKGRSLVRCLIAAPLSFEEDLARPTHADFSRRIRCHAFLQPLTSKESVEFLGRHLAAVGGMLRDVFTSASLEIIASAADGIPRCLILLADESLVVASERDCRIVDDRCVRAALSRLRHLPYAWNVSLQEHDFDSIDDDALTVPTSDRVTAVAMQQNPMPGSPVYTALSGLTELPSSSLGDTASNGVVEFGSGTGRRSIVETGAAVTAALNVPTVLAVCATSSAEVAEFAATTVGSLPKSAGFEVGHRFSFEKPTIADLSSPDDLYSIADPAVDFDDPCWFEQGEVARCTTESADSSAPINCVPELWASTEALAGMTEAGFSNRVPVFDRYTWIALGREVPSGTHLVSSASDMQRINDGLNFALDLSVPACAGCSATAYDHIEVRQTSDREIAESLCHTDRECRMGNGPGQWNPPETAMANPDGDDCSPGNSPPFDTAASAATDAVNVQDSESSARERFYALSVDVKSTDWDLRSAVVDFDEVLPLAETLAAFREEVTLFQQGAHQDFDAMQPSESESPESGTRDCGDEVPGDSWPAQDSLVERARCRLDDAGKSRLSFVGSEVQFAPPRSSRRIAGSRKLPEAPAVPDVVEALLWGQGFGAAENTHATVVAESVASTQCDSPPPLFGQLFTRLRQQRSDASETRK